MLRYIWSFALNHRDASIFQVFGPKYYRPTAVNHQHTDQLAQRDVSAITEIKSLRGIYGSERTKLTGGKWTEADGEPALRGA